MRMFPKAMLMLQSRQQASPFFVHLARSLANAWMERSRPVDPTSVLIVTLFSPSIASVNVTLETQSLHRVSEKTESAESMLGNSLQGLECPTLLESNCDYSRVRESMLSTLFDSRCENSQLWQTLSFERRMNIVQRKVSIESFISSF